MKFEVTYVEYKTKTYEAEDVYDAKKQVIQDGLQAIEINKKLYTVRSTVVVEELPDLDAVLMVLDSGKAREIFSETALTFLTELVKKSELA